MKITIIDGVLAKQQRIDLIIVAAWLNNQVNQVVVLMDFMVSDYANQLCQALRENDDTWQFVQKEGIMLLHKEKTFRDLERQLMGNGKLQIFDFNKMAIVIPNVDTKSLAYLPNQIEQISDYLYGQMKPMCLLPTQHAIDHLMTKGWRYANAQTSLGPIILTDATTTSKVTSISCHNQRLSNSVLLTLID
ncbi:hypothetical protein [Weissella hellenica]|uniref:Uncharacterized protein n=1 Tax=Weissella hellenica TaxID=46256 RepID=A0A4Y4FZD9_WEIHE|nr:hypothetical protein [Weissella hellenica]NKY66348.1 hypothetical protein [Weissella hellenica]GED35532.1 hypothetical protein WHE01_04360 [Weissella hellenica]SCB71928.1 hypothetical protein GA0061075_10123 [Weissella hellenica]